MRINKSEGVDIEAKKVTSVEKTEKKFNTAGPSVAGDHYMVDPLHRVDYDEISHLIDDKRYFVLHAPRQTGKTTSLLAMVEVLNAGDRYRCVYINVEAAQTERGNVAGAMRIIVGVLARQAERFLGEGRLLEEMAAIHDAFGNDAFGAALAVLSESDPRPLVLFVDEIDSLIGDTLVSVLRQLRAGYESRPGHFPVSVILCGVRDIRDYRIHTSEGEIITGGSCFNVKAESLRLGDFSQEEIKELYDQHTAESGQIFEDGVFPRVWKLTHGQPWLVNALAHEATWRMRENRDRTRPITLQTIGQAKENLILSRATHLDQLADKLREERVRLVIEPMLAGENWICDPTPDNVQYVIDLGLIRRDETRALVVSNDIYKEIIPRELTTILQDKVANEYDRPWYIAADGSIDMQKLLSSFQQFFRENSESWLERFDYKEAGFQLLLQAFLQRIVNGEGRIDREYGLGRGRTDLMVQWRYPKDAPRATQKEQRIVLELKVVAQRSESKGNPEKILAAGLEQTARYADQANATETHLIICDEREGKSWDEKIYTRRESFAGREICVWGL